MIGFFDSGNGGLTVYQALKNRYVDIDFLYYGDHARCPYGVRDAATIKDATQESISWLFEAGCRLVLLACNTATAVALRDLQQDWLPRSPYRNNRVLGIIAPTVEALTGLPWGYHGTAEDGAVKPGVYAVFATSRTVDSGVYARELKKRAPALTLLEQECPGLAGAIEEGAPRAVLQAHVQAEVDALLARLVGRPLAQVVLGCTHYALIEDLFRAALPAGVPVLSQGAIVAESLHAYLQNHPELELRKGKGRWQFLTTGDPARAAATARLLIKEELPFIHVATYEEKLRHAAKSA